MQFLYEHYGFFQKTYCCVSNHGSGENDTVHVPDERNEAVQGKEDLDPQFLGRHSKLLRDMMDIIHKCPNCR
jgi:hypothetical protein